jgi:hypothetical protein
MKPVRSRLAVVVAAVVAEPAGAAVGAADRAGRRTETLIEDV